MARTGFIQLTGTTPQTIFDAAVDGGPVVEIVLDGAQGGQTSGGTGTWQAIVQNWNTDSAVRGLQPFASNTQGLVIRGEAQPGSGYRGTIGLVQLRLTGAGDFYVYWGVTEV